MKLSNQTKSDLIASAYCVALTAVVVALLYWLSGCTVLDTVSATVEQSRQYCDSISETKEQYQQCMERETRFLTHRKNL